MSKKFLKHVVAASAALLIPSLAFADGDQEKIKLSPQAIVDTQGGSGVGVGIDGVDKDAKFDWGSRYIDFHGQATIGVVAKPEGGNSVTPHVIGSAGMTYVQKEYSGSPNKVKPLVGKIDMLRATPDFADFSYPHLAMTAFAVPLGARVETTPKGHVDLQVLPFSVHYDRNQDFTLYKSGVQVMSKHQIGNLLTLKAGASAALTYAGENGKDSKDSAKQEQKKPGIFAEAFAGVELHLTPNFSVAGDVAASTNRVYVKNVNSDQHTESKVMNAMTTTVSANAAF